MEDSIEKKKDGAVPEKTPSEGSLGGRKVKILGYFRQLGK